MPWYIVDDADVAYTGPFRTASEAEQTRVGCAYGGAGLKVKHVDGKLKYDFDSYPRYCNQIRKTLIALVDEAKASGKLHHFRLALDATALEFGLEPMSEDE